LPGNFAANISGAGTGTVEIVYSVQELQGTVRNCVVPGTGNYHRNTAGRFGIKKPGRSKSAGCRTAL